MQLKGENDEVKSRNRQLAIDNGKLLRRNHFLESRRRKKNGRWDQDQDRVRHHMEVADDMRKRIFTAERSTRMRMKLGCSLEK